MKYTILTVSSDNKMIERYKTDSLKDAESHIMEYNSAWYPGMGNCVIDVIDDNGIRVQWRVYYEGVLDKKRSLGVDE